MQTNRSREGISCLLDTAAKKQLARLTDHLYLECTINPTVQWTVFAEHDDITILRKSVQRVMINHVDFMENHIFTGYF